MKILKYFIFGFYCQTFTSADLKVTTNQSLSELAIAFSEISQGIKTTQTVTILNSENRKSSSFNELIMEIHRFQIQTCIFNETETFFKFIEQNLKASLEVSALIFHKPDLLIQKVRT